eukprot:11226261-Lingulodinium_polyedra.AAC.1
MLQRRRPYVPELNDVTELHDPASGACKEVVVKVCVQFRGVDAFAPLPASGPVCIVLEHGQVVYGRSGPPR